MVQTLDLTQIINPLAQTIRVTEPQGVVLTGVGLYFHSKPPSTSPDIPVFVEIRPVTESGVPSPYTRYPGTIVSKTRADITASETYDANNVEKFEFPVPLFVPENAELAIVVHTNAAAGEYKLWAGKLGEFEYGTTEKRITKQPNVGSFFSSSNGTTWSPIQTQDIAFKVYQAKFINELNRAVFSADVMPPRKLSHAFGLDNPMFFTNGDSDIKVVHGAHGLQDSDVVKITGLDSDTEYAGIFGKSILGKRVVKNVDAFGYTISADSAATSTVRSGGNNIFASGQMPFDEFTVKIPVEVPDNTEIQGSMDYYTHKYLGKNNTPYQSLTNIGFAVNKVQIPFKSGVIMNQYQESDRSVVDGSLKVKLDLVTRNQNVSPYINANITQFQAVHNLIDNPDSAGAFQGVNGYDSSGANGYNMVHTIPYVSETEPTLGSATAKHITVPITLATTATSIKVYMDAERPVDTEFEVYYRTAIVSDVENPIINRNWIKFATNSSSLDRSNYDDLSANDRQGYKEYFFSKFDLQAFDQLQIKITMYSKLSNKVPKFANLRVLSTL